MKTSASIILGMLCFAFLSSCSGISGGRAGKEIVWDTLQHVTVEWDAPIRYLDGSPIAPDKILRYNVYIDTDTDNTHDDRLLLTEAPISETKFTIPTIEHKGQYFIGIQALAFEVKDGKIHGEPEKSVILWSDNTSTTKDGPFGIRIE